MNEAFQREILIWFDGLNFSGRKTTIASHLINHNPPIDLYSGHNGSWKWTLNNYQHNGQQRTISIAFGKERSTYGFKTLPWNKNWDAEKENLKMIDGIIFVVNSHGQNIKGNQLMLDRLRDNLVHVGRNFELIPLVFQLNKRDLKDNVPLGELKDNLKWPKCEYFPSIATEQLGVVNPFVRIIEMIDQINQNAANF